MPSMAAIRRRTRPIPCARSSGSRAGSSQLRWVEADHTVGYNGRWTARDRRRIATISVGYADGYPRSASARGHSGETLLAGMALVAGHPCPFAGTVSMDLIAIDVTEMSDTGEAGRCRDPDRRRA